MTGTSKSYYLPPARSIAVGIILIIAGIGFCCIGIDLNNSLAYNLQSAFLSFHSIATFIASLIMLLFKAGFIFGGYFYIKYSDGVKRAELDDHGFYYRDIPKGGGMKKVGIDLGPLSFAPYNAIKDITYKKTFWTGGQLTLTLSSGTIPLIALGPLKDKDKQEIAELVKARINPGGR